jgi:hypothetical protein
MRRLISCLVLLAFLAAAPRATRDLPKEPAVETSSGSAVTALSDGLYTYKGVDTRHGPQCVEYAERFYQTHYEGTFPYHNSGPGAYDIWEGIAEQKDVGGWPAHRQHFIAYENGTTRPQPDDMLLYDRTRGEGWGHIAIIAEVHPNAVVILEQNSRWDTRKILPMIDNRILDNGVKGVIRLKSKDIRNPL